MFLPTYKPVLIKDEEWKDIWEKAYENLLNDPMFILNYSKTKEPRALKFSFVRELPQNPDTPEKTMKTELYDILLRENIKYVEGKYYIIRLFVGAYNKYGLAIFELWDINEE
ncbi:hypothetical protein KC660_04745 [Candidatus Dojkabacteria bacterium]|uniref:Uncharacterized protein n=1 Tax=Candidatus Dojkabacteria bacterium TaxID=2099670 RepID=A0A955L4H7_9BACT|nr:hypothetical protein [Candidatus Dojkabacteria bacterium]